jgi:hypothetical protein
MPTAEINVCTAVIKHARFEPLLTCTEASFQHWRGSPLTSKLPAAWDEKSGRAGGIVMVGRQKLPRSEISGPAATHNFVAFSLLSNLQPLLTADCSSLVI